MCGKEAELVERSRSKAELQGAALGAARVPPAPVARGAKSQKNLKKISNCSWVRMHWDKEHVINSGLERGRAGKS